MICNRLFSQVTSYLVLPVSIDGSWYYSHFTYGKTDAYKFIQGYAAQVIELRFEPRSVYL